MSYIYKKVGSGAGSISFHYELQGDCSGRIDGWVENQSTYNHFTMTPLPTTITFSWPASTSMNPYSITATPVLYIDDNDSGTCLNRTIVIEQAGKESKCNCITSLTITKNIPQEGADSSTGVQVGTITLGSGCSLSKLRFISLDYGTLYASSGKIYAKGFSENIWEDPITYGFNVEYQEDNGTYSVCDTIEVIQNGLKDSCTCYALTHFAINQNVTSIPTEFGGDSTLRTMVSSGLASTECGDIEMIEPDPLPSDPSKHKYEVQTISEAVAGTNLKRYEFWGTFYELSVTSPGLTANSFALNYKVVKGSVEETCNPVMYVTQSPCGSLDCPTEPIGITMLNDANVKVWEDIHIPWRVCDATSVSKKIGFNKDVYSTFTCSNEDFNNSIPYGLTVKKLDNKGYEWYVSDYYYVDDTNNLKVYYLSPKFYQKLKTNWRNTPIEANYRASFNHDMTKLDDNAQSGDKYGVGGVACEYRDFKVIQDAFPSGCSCSEFSLTTPTDYTINMDGCNSPLSIIRIESDCYQYYDDINDPLCKHYSLARYHVDSANTDDWLSVSYIRDEFEWTRECIGKITLRAEDNPSAVEPRTTTFELKYNDPNGNVCGKVFTVTQAACVPDICEEEECGCGRIKSAEVGFRSRNVTLPYYFSKPKTSERDEFGGCVTSCCSGGSFSVECTSFTEVAITTGEVIKTGCGLYSLSTGTTSISTPCASGITLSYNSIASGEVDRIWGLRVTHTNGDKECVNDITFTQRGALILGNCDEIRNKVTQEFPFVVINKPWASVVSVGDKLFQINERYAIRNTLTIEIINNNPTYWELNVEEDEDHVKRYVSVASILRSNMGVTAVVKVSYGDETCIEQILEYMT